MKTAKFHYFLIIAAVFSYMLTGCQKDSNSTSSSGSLANQQIAQVQNSDVQDAVADKSDQDVDKSIDELQANNYQVSTTKSAFESEYGSKTITVDHPDSTYFPKLITIVYVNYQDSTADERFVKNGEIDIVVSATGADKQLITKTHTFKGYSVTTDSTTVTINGTRTVTRTAHNHKYNGLSSLRLVTTDNIAANLSYAIVKTGQTDTLKFTRIVSKLRTSILHYDNVGGTTWKLISFKNNLSKDTITFSGTVTGVNEKGENYTKTISSASPLIISFYKGTPVVVSGTMDLTVTGTTAASYTVTYKEDLPNHPYKTLVTVTNNTTLKSHSFDRRFGSKFTKWW
jgi:hypothetical protein